MASTALQPRRHPDTLPVPGDLPGADLSGADLRGVDLTDRDLSNADLAGADLTGAVLVRANLSGARLDGAILDRAELLGANLSGVHAPELSAHHAGFGRACLAGASFFGANLEGATFPGADLTGADFRACAMPGARLRDADLSAADFTGADLSGADLTKATVPGARFEDSNLDRSRLGHITGFERAYWIGVSLLETDFRGAWGARRFIVDENYLAEFRGRDRLHEWLYRVWWLTSDCGRSFARWGACTLVLAVVFAGAYSLVDLDYGDHETALSPFYFSIVTLTTLGYGDVLPASTGAQILTMCEVIIGYVMLGGLLGIFANKMARRAD